MHVPSNRAIFPYDLIGNSWDFSMFHCMNNAVLRCKYTFIYVSDHLCKTTKIQAGPVRTCQCVLPRQNRAAGMQMNDLPRKSPKSTVSGPDRASFCRKSAGSMQTLGLYQLKKLDSPIQQAVLPCSGFRTHPEPFPSRKKESSSIVPVFRVFLPFFQHANPHSRPHVIHYIIPLPLLTLTKRRSDYFAKSACNP